MLHQAESRYIIAPRQGHRLTHVCLRYQTGTTTLELYPCQAGHSRSPDSSTHQGIGEIFGLKKDSSTMSSNILHPPAHLSPSVALQLSQQAPIILKDTPSSISPFSIKSLYAASESVELWTSYENLMLSCLRTGDDESALLCLERLTVRFGTANERLMALHGLYQEATAENDAALQKVLEKYDAIIAEDPSNMVRATEYVIDCNLLTRDSQSQNVELHSRSH